jgi:hypothetical protein
MDFELYLPRSFNALIAPREMFIQALNRNLNMQRFRMLYVTGNHSTILSELNHRGITCMICIKDSEIMASSGMKMKTV